MVLATENQPKKVFARKEVGVVTSSQFVRKENHLMSFYQCPACTKGQLETFYRYCPACGIELSWRLEE